MKYSLDTCHNSDGFPNFAQKFQVSIHFGQQKTERIGSQGVFVFIKRVFQCFQTVLGLIQIVCGGSSELQVETTPHYLQNAKQDSSL